MRQSEHAADQKEKGEHGKPAKKQDRVPPLVGQTRYQQRDEQDHADCIGQIDPPPLTRGIEAVHELAELGRNKGPAGADLAADGLWQAVDAARSIPHRVDQ